MRKHIKDSSLRNRRLYAINSNLLSFSKSRHQKLIRQCFLIQDPFALVREVDQLVTVRLGRVPQLQFVSFKKIFKCKNQKIERDITT